MTFTRTLFLSLLSLMLVAQAYAQTPEAVVGTWLLPDGKSHVKIYKCGKEGIHYCGLITWLKDPNKAGTTTPLVDENNPDPSLKTRKIQDLVIMHSFTYNKDNNKWENGKIYDPNNGKTYSCQMHLKDGKTLEVRGYVGAPVFGRTEVWTRVK